MIKWLYKILDFYVIIVLNLASCRNNVVQLLYFRFLCECSVHISPTVLLVEATVITFNIQSCWRIFLFCNSYGESIELHYLLEEFSVEWEVPLNISKIKKMPKRNAVLGDLNNAHACSIISLRIIKTEALNGIVRL